MGEELNVIPLARGISVLMPNAPKFYPYCICMYIAGEQRAVIDFGAGQKAFNEIDIKSIELGFFTHNHPDHTHSAVLFKHSSLYAAKEEEQSYQSEKDYLDLRGFEYWNLYMPGKALPEPPDATLQNPDIPVEPGFVKIDLAGTITDGQQIELGRGIRMTAIHLPGHSIGHYGFYFEKEGILFGGDIDTTRAGPWYGDGCSNVGQFINSVERIKEINPGTYASSHRRPLTENIIPSLEAYIQVLLDRENRVYDLLKQPHSIEELASYHLAFNYNMFSMEDFWEMMYAYHHVQHLMEIGAVVEVAPGIFQQA